MEKKYTRIYFSIYSRVFTKSIISHLFLNHFHRNNSIYEISTPSYRGKEEICSRMLRNFFSLAQFQRKRKSLVFFQSINFLWPPPEVTVLNPSDLLGKEKTCFSQKRYGHVIDWFREIRHAHQWEFEEHSWRWNNIVRGNRGSVPTVL